MPIEGRRKSFYGEIWGNAVRVSRVRGELVKISWGSPCVTILEKLLNTFESIFDACFIGFCHKTA